VLNPILPLLPLGTLAANLCGGFLMGIALQALAAYPSAPPALRLAVMTDFLGWFTTFSTFSSEVVALFVRRRYSWAFCTYRRAVVGALALSAARLVAAQWLLGRGEP
jgi:CrcB protein